MSLNDVSLCLLHAVELLRRESALRSSPPVEMRSSTAASNVARPTSLPLDLSAPSGRTPARPAVRGGGDGARRPRHRRHAVDNTSGGGDEFDDDDDGVHQRDNNVRASSVSRLLSKCEFKKVF